jgi:hypothetical protein
MSTSRSTLRRVDGFCRVTFDLRDEYDSQLAMRITYVGQLDCGYGIVTQLQLRALFQYLLYMFLFFGLHRPSVPLVEVLQQKVCEDVLPHPVVLPRLELPMYVLSILQILPLRVSISDLALGHIDPRLGYNGNLRIVAIEKRHQRHSTVSMCAGSFVASPC